MRPIASTKISNTITATLTPALYDQLLTHATTQHLSQATIIRNAVRTFVDDPQAFQRPEGFDTLLTPINLGKTKHGRNRTVGLTINPKRDPDLRDRLEIYATMNALTISAVIRRAVYETTRKENPDPIATIDAWIDGYTPATTPTHTLRVIVTQPKQAPTNTRSDITNTTNPNQPIEGLDF